MHVGRIVIAATVALFMCYGSVRCEAEAPCTACNGPGCVDMWIINTRCAAYCGEMHDSLDRIVYFHCEPTGWVPYSLKDFVAATDSDLPVCFYVHGIFSSSDPALKQAKTLFGTVGAGLPAFRGVLWSWPSDFECGTSLTDQVYRGISHTPSEAYYLATVIDAIHPRVPISLVGHSLGSRIVVATLHGLAEREISGQRLTEPLFPQPRPIQAALVAAAITPYALWPGGEYSSTLSQVDRILITYNSEDRVLRAFERRLHRQALGKRGLSVPQNVAESFQKARQINANPAVGKRHLPSVYFESPAVAGWLRGYVSYLKPPEPVPPPP